MARQYLSSLAGGLPIACGLKHVLPSSITGLEAACAATESYADRWYAELALVLLVCAEYQATAKQWTQTYAHAVSCLLQLHATCVCGCSPTRSLACHHARRSQQYVTQVHRLFTQRPKLEWHQLASQVRSPAPLLLPTLLLWRSSRWLAWRPRCRR